MKSAGRFLAAMILLVMAAWLGGCVPEVGELGQAASPVIYGVDDRKDIYQVTDQKYLGWYPSTGGLMSAGDVSCANGWCSLVTSMYAADYLLCPSER